MNRFWAGLFLLVPLLGVGTYLCAAWGVGPLRGLWLPESYSQAGDTIDYLFVVLHLICAVILVITGLALTWSVWRYGSRQRERAAYFTHDNRLELIWSIIPGGILVFIALFQMQSWEANKLNRPHRETAAGREPVPPLVKVVARRFGWEFHHAGNDGLLDTFDDLYVENELIVPYGEPVVLQVESRDVIHSFFVPTLRLKHDIVPGLRQWVWFESRQAAVTTIICAELCGWGHYTMQAQMKLVSRGDYDAWVNQESERQGKHSAVAARQLSVDGHVAQQVSGVAVGENLAGEQP